MKMRSWKYGLNDGSRSSSRSRVIRVGGFIIIIIRKETSCGRAEVSKGWKSFDESERTSDAIKIKKR